MAGLAAKAPTIRDAESKQYKTKSRFHGCERV